MKAIVLVALLVGWTPLLADSSESACAKEKISLYLCNQSEAVVECTKAQLVLALKEALGMIRPKDTPADGNLVISGSGTIATWSSEVRRKSHELRDEAKGLTKEAEALEAHDRKLKNLKALLKLCREDAKGR